MSMRAAEPRSGRVLALSYAVILLAALLAVLPMLLAGPSCGHDLTFHLLNWMDAAHQWRNGTLRPWWCAAAAWNTGEPRFLFYPPLSWVLGGLLTLVLGAAHAPVAYTWVALTASGITMRRFLVAYVSQPRALLGACLYLAHPYMLFAATERTAYAELLAAAWLPWLLQEALRADGPIRPTRLAIPVALLWLTNTPAAVLSSYTLAVVLILRSVLAVRNDRPIWKPLLIPATLGYLLGLALSAFYLLPAIVQHSTVEVAQAFTAGMRPDEGTLFAHTGQPLHDQVVHQASVLALILLGAAACALLIRRISHPDAQRFHGMRDRSLHHAQGALPTWMLPALVALTLLTAFLLTPASLFLWHHLPELQFLQFPWRTLMLQGVITVTLVVLAIRAHLHLRWAAAIALAAVAMLSFAAHHQYSQFCDDEDAPTSLRVQFQQGAGFEPYDEYTPKDADNDLIHAGEPSAWTAANAAAPPSSTAAEHAHALTSASPDTVTVVIHPAPTDHFLIVRHRAFRNWHVTLDGKTAPHTDDRDDDLIAVPLPDSNPHTVALHYRWSLDQYAGIIISTVAALLLILSGRIARYPHKG